MKYNDLLKGTLKTIVLNLLEKNGKMYGYEISKSVTTITSSEINLTFGALYPVLHKLESEELLKTETEMINGRARKYYVLTKKGKAESKIKSAEFFEFMNTMSKLLQINSIPHA